MMRFLLMLFGLLSMVTVNILFIVMIVDQVKELETATIFYWMIPCCLMVISNIWHYTMHLAGVKV